MFRKPEATKETFLHTFLESDLFRMSSLQTRYRRLYYPGCGTDATPLPIAESALYVDPLPSFYPKKFPNGKHGNESAEKFLLNRLLKLVKKLFLLQEEPIVDWSTSPMNCPIAEVLFTWNDMPGLTLNGQTTKLTYLFNTLNEDLASENMSHFLLGVDILWSADGWGARNFRHIDLTKMVIASRNFLNLLPFDSEDQAKKSKFYHILPLESYQETDGSYGKHGSGYPEYLPMLLSRMLQQGTLCFEDHQNYARFWLLNYNNQKQDSVFGTGGAGETIAALDCKALQEVSQKEKELILVLSAAENDLKSLKELESLGTSIDARIGI
jgi:hypothetical protein